MKKFAIEGFAFLAGIALAALIASSPSAEAVNVVPLLGCSYCGANGYCQGGSDSTPPVNCPPPGIVEIGAPPDQTRGRGLWDPSGVRTQSPVTEELGRNSIAQLDRATNVDACRIDSVKSPTSDAPLVPVTAFGDGPDENRRVLAELRRQRGEQVRACHRAFVPPQRDVLAGAVTPEPIEQVDPAEADLAALNVGVLLPLRAITDGYEVGKVEITGMKLVFQQNGRAVSAPIADANTERCLSEAWSDLRLYVRGVVPGATLRLETGHWLVLRYPQRVSSKPASIVPRP